MRESVSVSPACKACGGLRCVKNGFDREQQRYRCSECRYNFTDTKPRGENPAKKALALLLYGMGNMSFRMIARVLGASHVAVYKWVRAEAEKLPEPEIPATVEIVNLDEMWHFVKKRLRNSGFGARMTLSVGELWPGCVVAVMMKPVKN
jgi:transposase